MNKLMDLKQFDKAMQIALSYNMDAEQIFANAKNWNMTPGEYLKYLLLEHENRYRIIKLVGDATIGRD